MARRCQRWTRARAPSPHAPSRPAALAGRSAPPVRRERRAAHRMPSGMCHHRRRTWRSARVRSPPPADGATAPHPRRRARARRALHGRGGARAARASARARNCIARSRPRAARARRRRSRAARASGASPTSATVSLAQAREAKAKSVQARRSLVVYPRLLLLPPAGCPTAHRGLGVCGQRKSRWKG
eukprot:scaffold175504_cov24-Tisochrysis_lutea.AAC.2